MTTATLKTRLKAHGGYYYRKLDNLPFSYNVCRYNRVCFTIGDIRLLSCDTLDKRIAAYESEEE